MRPPSYYTSLANSNSANRHYVGSSSSQQFRSSFTSPSSSAYVTRTHLPFVSQSMLVAHCITGSGSSTKPYGNQSSSSSSLRVPGSSGSSSYSTSYGSRTASTKRQPSSSYLTSTSSSPSSSSTYLSPRSSSYLSSSSRSSTGAGSSYRPSLTTSSYYKPIRLRERPLLTQISRPSYSTTTAKAAPEPKASAAPDNDEKSDGQAEDWSNDVARNISRNKYLIKFREKDHRPSVSPVPEPSAEEPPKAAPIEPEERQQVASQSAEMRLPQAPVELDPIGSQKSETPKQQEDCDTTASNVAVAESEKKKAPKAKKNIKLKLKNLNSSSATDAKVPTSKDKDEQLVNKDLAADENCDTPKVTKVKRLVKTSGKGKSGANSGGGEENSNVSSKTTGSKPSKSGKKVLSSKVVEQTAEAPKTAPPIVVDLQKAASKSGVDSPGSADGEKKRIRFREYNFNDFNFLTVLGHGGWGFVILAELKKHDAFFAVKCIKKITIVEDDDFDSIMIERKVLALGNVHPFICKLFCTFETDGYLFFVMEYCAGGDLMFHVQKEGKFSESRCRFYAAEIICAIRFLHNRHIIYRDLKLDNILLDSKGHIRLVDFGMCQCRTYREEMLPSNFCGTPEYISPEIIKGVPYNHSVDWWSFGVLLYEMAVGKMPFRGNDENELLWNVCYEQIHYPMFLTKELTTLLQLLLEREPAKRMGMATCKAGDIYEQPWFRGVDWKAMEAMRVEPPFVPEVNSKRDVQNFDADFTESTPELSPVDQETLGRIDQSQFQKFPYTNPDIFIFE